MRQNQEIPKPTLDFKKKNKKFKPTLHLFIIRKK